MKNKIQTIAVLTVAILLLVVSVSFAWMLQVDDSLLRYLLLDYTQQNGNSLVVASHDVEMSILRQIDEDTFNETQEDMVISELIPGNAQTFRIRIKNHSQNTINLKLSMANVSGDLITERTDDKTGTMLDALFISMRGGLGYIGNNLVVPSLYKRLNQDSTYNSVSNTYSVVLFSALEVPPTEGDGYVELNCYFYLDPDAGMEYQSKNLVIGTFRAET